MEKLKKLIFRLLESADILLIISDNNLSSKIYKNYNLSYSYIYRKINILKDLDLIKIEKKGRKKYLRYTDKGLKILTKILEINTILNNKMEETKK